MIDNGISVVRGGFEHLHLLVKHCYSNKNDTNIVNVRYFFNLFESVDGLRHNVLREEFAHKVRSIPMQEWNEFGLVVRVEDACGECQCVKHMCQRSLPEVNQSPTHFAIKSITIIGKPY